MQRAVPDLGGDGGGVRCRHVGPLADRPQERRRCDQVESGRPAQVDHDGFRGADLDTPEPVPDRGECGVVAGEADPLEALPAIDEVRRIPQVRVPPGGDADQRAHVEHRPRAAVRRQQALHPRVVAGAVAHRHLGVGQPSGIGRRRLVGVGVRLRVGDDALDVGVGAPQLGDDAPPDVLRRHHPDHPGGVRRRALAPRRQGQGAAGQEDGDGQQGGDRTGSAPAPVPSTADGRRGGERHGRSLYGNDSHYNSPSPT